MISLAKLLQAYSTLFDENYPIKESGKSEEEIREELTKCIQELHPVTV